ncbi:hypothetical protein A3C20_04275 [Candidatus Kaiserbacteria bacterium RIFCSPHIGHO2_02_FULL_55_25]|uniref:Ada DNA repair metal-binding domain-containing protein n=1 Tax=Candidatus Kaiserbacteria bacterium RIFCSPHIGHO2_02_FULL_55_25 TaxID=1798498 RepID=A0A1F6EAL1_9BACT|nr:MAG: hypothetical protein A2764_03140 [Candidatus Kaiserbacteria bacterium RIFCSPHIGHO2_01_FULL_55_79]OGG70709.1 MAG: hypothetical protein A3C20_04275 [Candidatus Kaiserbacteria bacterium RIFCSPHIGHO2_02_FULL_55_25]OGG77173.1 MAG: hypothetical protein A3F56_05080 [Candidatus Kaiserbacteria bacterium RIFCSPHIGHO2_12_FULL_55_13]OGG84012.1 MAG: hypothetical protein A3A42_03115 [Candidatus Kaiserbacteria bacterium RIFCSPLOWO2_01_FULL_55_25]
MRNIQEYWQKIKGFLDAGIGDWGLVAIIFLTALGSFGLGRLSALVEARPPVPLTMSPEKSSPAALAMGGLVVAAWSGTVYYYPWCSGAGNIALQNQRWFTDEKSAQAAGYRPAKNCKGLAQ